MVAAVNPTIGPLADLPARISDVVLPWAERSPDRAALVDSGGTWTYGQLAAVIVETRCWLLARGVRPGDRVMIVGENCRALVAVILAAAALDAWPVIVSARLSDREIDQIRDHSDARRLLYTATASPLAKSHAGRHGARIEDVAQLGPIGIGPLNEAAEPEPIEAARGAQVAALIYTSGTTGRPKGVMLTHRNLVANLLQTDSAHSLEEQDRVMAVLPFFHIYGMQVVLNLALWRGATLVTMPKFDLEPFLAALERYRITRAFVVPPLVLALAKHPAVDDYDLSSLRGMMSGAAPLDAALETACVRRVGCRLIQGYGLTEASPVTHANPDDPGKIKPGTVGPLLPGTECRIVDPATGADLDVEEDGELLIRGPQVMRGYLNNPEATAATLDAGGWLHTGDIGHVDADGYFTIVDRLKELIKYKGFQVAPAELEALLCTHPAVADAAVIPIPDDECGEVPKAFVVLKGETSPAALIAYVAEHVAPYKKVRVIEVIDAIPKSPSGKILRRLLKERERAAAVS